MSTRAPEPSGLIALLVSALRDILVWARRADGDPDSMRDSLAAIRRVARTALRKVGRQ